LGLRQFLESDESSLHYEHTAGMMHATQQVTVHGPSHLVEMGIRVTVEFDEANRVAAVFVQPSDLGLFDHVIGAALLDKAFGL
jgi:hypothetical protein